MVVTPQFPRRLLREKQHSWNLAGTIASPGQTAFPTVVRSDGGGYWTCSMTDVSLGANTSEQGLDRQRKATLLWRAVRQVANGGASAIVVPRNDALFRPWPDGIAQGEQPVIPHSDDTLFDDDTGYVNSVISIVSDAAALRATTFAITIRQAGQLVGGECFSIPHPTMGWRMYEIGAVVYSSDTRAAVNFNPPLREAVGANTDLEFDRPRCTMRLSAPGAMDLTVQPWTFNNASVQLVEARI